MGLPGDTLGAQRGFLGGSPSRHPLFPPQEQSWVSQKQAAFPFQELLEQRLSARHGIGLGKAFPKRGPCTPAGPQFREIRRQNTSLRRKQARFPDVSSLRYGLPLQLLFLCPERAPIHSCPPHQADPHPVHSHFCLWPPRPGRRSAPYHCPSQHKSRTQKGLEADISVWMHGRPAVASGGIHWTVIHRSLDTRVQVLALQVSPQNSPASVFTSVGQGNHSCLPPWAAVETLPSKKKVNSCGWDCEGHLERPDKWGLGSVWMGPWGRERVEAHVVKSRPVGKALNPRPQTFLGVALTVMVDIKAPKVGEARKVILTIILRWQRQTASSWVLGPLRQEAPMPPACGGLGPLPTSGLMPSASHLPLSPRSTTSLCERRSG